MSWVLKRIISSRQFFWVRTTNILAEEWDKLFFITHTHRKFWTWKRCHLLITPLNICPYNMGGKQWNETWKTAMLLKQGFWYHKIRKAFSKYFHRHSEFIVSYNIGLKTLLQQGISEPTFYGDLVYKFKRIVVKSNFSDQFKKIVKCYIRVGYNLDIMLQSACLVLNPITVYSCYGFLFNCTTVGQASDSMTALT